jgi:uncharacterized protein (DUF1684 family)
VDSVRPDPLELADWRRRVAELYAEVRRMATDDPRGAWARWCATRERLYREHPQSPLPATARRGFESLTFPYDPSLRFALPLRPAASGGSAEPATPAIALPSSGDSVPPMRLIGTVELPGPLGPHPLSVFWLEGYAGGLFLPFGDATNGRETYGAGRYLLDTTKGADLGTTPDGRLVIDLNFAYHPSCAFDPRWTCPLAPPENRIASPIEAGERLA